MINQKILNNLFFLIVFILLFLTESCDDPGTTQPCIVKKDSIRITSINEKIFDENGQINIQAAYQHKTTKLIYMQITTIEDNDGTCIVYENYFTQDNTCGTFIKAINISELNYNNPGSYCTTPHPINNNNRNFLVKLWVESDNGLTQADYRSVTVGTVNYNVRCYYMSTLNCLPNGWNPVVQACSTYCPGNALVTHPINEGNWKPNEEIVYIHDIQQWLINNMSGHGFTPANYNTSILLGMYIVNGLEPSVVGITPYQRVVCGSPAAGLVLVRKINDRVGSYGWDAEKSEKVKTIISAHELVHCRGVLGHIDHDESCGSNYQYCSMGDKDGAIQPDDNFLNNPIFCMWHETYIRHFSW